MDNELVRKYTELKSAQEDINTKLAVAESRMTDADLLLREAVGEVKEMGFETASDLSTAIEETEGLMRSKIEEAEDILRVGGYA